MDANLYADTCFVWYSSRKTVLGGSLQGGHLSVLVIHFQVSGYKAHTRWTLCHPTWHARCHSPVCYP